jgi:addiction module RelB/DinJ family antitoxin
MNTASILIKTDPEVKSNAQQLANQLGITLTDVFNAALRNFIRTREIYISDIPRMTPELEKLLDKVEEDLKTGKNLSPTFKTAKDAWDYLDSQ